VLVRDERKLYVGDSLRNLNAYILLGVDSIQGYGTAREFSHADEDGVLRVARPPSGSVSFAGSGR
jgi:hypothetical protein